MHHHKHKHKMKLFTWLEGRLFVEEHFADSHEECKRIAHHRGPHSFKIYCCETDELEYSEICDHTKPPVPDYA